ncbi:Meiosis-specific serine/threonine-protein kinase mek1 [Tulasnella sp. 425]|nr:Meiosis-specific serine/threonine-protein kinase mek1 [Tulasnella sp. 425]
MTRTTTHSSSDNNNPRKRTRRIPFGSDDDESDANSPPPPAKRPSVLYAASKPELQQYHAKLTTVGASGCIEEIYIALDRPVSVGRSSSWYEYTCYYWNDVSTNGTLWNGHLIKKTAIIVADGDVLEIPQSQSFRVRIRNKFETNIYPRQADPPSSSSSTRLHPSISYQRIGTHLISNQYLGDGSFGKVRLAIDTAGHRQLACKTISISPHAGHNATREVVQKEIDILKGLDHLNINKITDVFYEHAEQNIHIFLELCTGGDLLQFIEDRVQVGEGESKYIGLQLMKALSYLHARKISHRDLKPENVLVHAPGAYPRIILADFGFARDNSFERTHSLAGTVSYVPPEALSVLFGYGMGSQAPSFDSRRGGKHPFDYGYDSAENSYASRYDSTPVATTNKRSYRNSPWASFELDIPSPQDLWRRNSSGEGDSPCPPPAEIAQERSCMKNGQPLLNDVVKRRTLERDATLKPVRPRNEPEPEHCSYAESYNDSFRSTVSEHMIKKRIMSGPVTFDWMGWGSRPEGIVDYRSSQGKDSLLNNDIPVAKCLISKLLEPDPKARLTIKGALGSAWIAKDLQAIRKMYEKRIGPF